MNNSKIISFLKTAAEAASKEIRKYYFTNENSVKEKGSHQDIVTMADESSQSIIHKILLDGAINELGFEKSSIGFIEEESKVDENNLHTFVVDPLDGTTNYSLRIPGFCVSIAYAYKKQVVAGLVFNPLTEEYYFAEKDCGSFFVDLNKNVNKLNPVSAQLLKNSMIAGHLNGVDVYLKQMDCYRKLYPHVRGIRNIGSLTYDLCHLSTGGFSAVFCGGCFIWDFAAAGLIMSELGLMIFDEQGTELEYQWQNPKQKYSLIACHPNQLQEILNICK